MNQDKKPAFLLLFHLTGSCLGSALVFAAFPSIRGWLLVPMVGLLGLLFLVMAPTTKVILVVSTLALGVYSFLLGLRTSMVAGLTRRALYC